MFTWLEGTEFTAGINKNNCLILHMDDEVGPAIPVDITEFAGDGYEVGATAKERRTGIDNRVSCIPAGEFYDDHVAIHIQKNEVRRFACAVLVPYYCVYLIGTRHAICRVFLMLL